MRTPISGSAYCQPVVTITMPVTITADRAERVSDEVNVGRA